MEAAKNAQGLLQIHLVKVQEERDAQEKGMEEMEELKRRMEGM